MPDNLHRKKALEGDSDMLMALTRDLLKEQDATNLAAGEALLKSAWTGDAEACYRLGLELLGQGKTSYFLTDHDLAVLWLRRAAHKAHKDAHLLLPTLGPVDMESYRDPLAELEQLTGLAAAKKAIAEQANRRAFMKARAAHGLPESPGASLHLVFAGNPGTGKTTVARIFGRLLKQIGFLKSGHVVEVSVAEMIGKWVGETPQKVQAKVTEALDGVLFIDEAYGLMGHTTHTGNSYGAEAVTTLLKLMEDNRDRLVVIAAGYPGKMREFLDYNPGLKSRFTEIIDFADYTPGEMEEIYHRFMHEGKYTITPDAAQLLRKVMAEAPHMFPENFPNARLVRHLFEDSIKYLATRVMANKTPAREDFTTITLPDVEKAFAEMNQTQ